MSMQLPPRTSITLLRSKAGQLEQQVVDAAANGEIPLGPLASLIADVALIASLLADEIERRS